MQKKEEIPREIPICQYLVNFIERNFIFSNFLFTLKLFLFTFLTLVIR